MSTPALVAKYGSPKSSQNFSESLPPLAGDSGSQDVRAKTAYLSALRGAASQMQGDINAFLTRKMEEDKERESGKMDGKKSTYEKEELMYGEEDPEADG